MDWTMFIFGFCMGISLCLFIVAISRSAKEVRSRRVHKKNVAQLRDALIKAIAKEAAEKAGKNEADS